MKMKLTKRAVEAIPVRSIPAGRNYIRIWDSEVGGYGVKVTPKGARVYFLKYRLKGWVRWYTIGRHGAAWTADKARTEANRLVGKIADGIDPAEQKAAAKKAETVGELCDLYIAACERGEVLGRRGNPKKSSTLATDRGRIDRHIRPLLGPKRVIDVTGGDIRRFQSDVAAGKTAVDVKTGHRGRAIVKGGRGTAARTVGLLGGIFTFAVDHGLRGGNPVRGVRKFSDAKKERFLSSSELARLGDALSAAEADGSEMSTTLTAIRLLALTGARKSEIVTAKWDYVNWESGHLILSDSKTGPKAIPLGAAALEVLKNAPSIKDNPYICWGEKKGDHLKGLQKAWERIRARAKLPGLRLHDLRHGFASVSASSGDSLIVIGRLLGHRDQASTARYSHLRDDPVRAAADRVSGEIDATMRRKQKAEVVELKRQG